MSKCPECGQEREKYIPSSKTGEPIYGRGMDEERCGNERCRRFGR